MPYVYDSDSPASSTSGLKRCANFRISEATVEDVRRLVDIEFHAFENERANQQLSYRDHHKPEHFQRSVDLYRDAMQVIEEQRTHAKLKRNSITCFLKITDCETDEIVSFAKTEVKTYTDEELASPHDVGHQKEPRMNRDWFALNERLRREYIRTARHCYIGMLATEPRHQHNGAGTMLLERILSEADDAGIEVYLEGTDTAKTLYERHGFQAINDIFFDPSEYGVNGLGTEHQTVMVRGALGRDGRRQEVRSWAQLR